MIRREAEYRDALRRAKHDRELAQQQREALVQEGMGPEEVERAERLLDVIHASLELRMAPANDRELVEA
jgi:hypothetical protein